MYTRVYYQRKKNKMHFSHYKDGKLVNEVIPWVPYFWVQDGTGKTKYKSIDNKPLRKLTFDNYRAYASYAADIRFSKKKTYFSNVSPECLFILEQYLHDDLEKAIPAIHIHYLDIECEVNHGFPEPEKAPERINLITVFSTKTKRFITFGLEKEWDSTKSKRPVDDVDYVCCADEHELLTKWIEFHATDYPDVLSGWNSSGFDIPYLINRCAKILDEQEDGFPKMPRGGQSDQAKERMKEYVARMKECKNTRKLSPYKLIEKKASKKKDNFTGEMKESIRYFIYGVSCIDYIELYKKMSMGQRESYTLNDIAELETGEKKVEYDGGLKDFYTKDWDKFVEYNIQDVRLLPLLDDTLGYMNLAFSICYMCKSPFEEIFGTIRKIDNAIACFMMRENKILEDIDHDKNVGSFTGAYVKDPVRGNNKWVQSFDITSLYPTNIMMLNISKETKKCKIECLQSDFDEEKNLVDMADIATKGVNTLQRLSKKDLYGGEEHSTMLRGFREEVRDLYIKLVAEDDDKKKMKINGKIRKLKHERMSNKVSNAMVHVRRAMDAIRNDNPIPDDVEEYIGVSYDSTNIPEFEKTNDVAKMIIENKYNVSENGVIFEDSDKQYGVIPSILRYWFSQRMDMQGEKKGSGKAADAILQGGSSDEKEGLVMRKDAEKNSVYITPEQATQFDEFSRQERLFDVQQYTLKILLNSTYGFLSTPYSRFYDYDLAEAVTCTGQKVIKENEVFVNDYFKDEFFQYDLIRKKFKNLNDVVDTNDVSIYIDTDSIYLSYTKILNRLGIDAANKDLCVKVIKFAEKFLSKKFELWNNEHSRYSFNANNLIKFNREIIADSTLFIQKKRYCCHVVDDEGKSVDKLKVTGLEIVRSSTPKLVKGFLKKTIEDILKKGDYEYTKDMMCGFYEKFNDSSIPEISFPRSVNNIEKWLFDKDNKPIKNTEYRSSTPIHVKASILHNRLTDAKNLVDVEPIRGGDKVKFIHLITNSSQPEKVIAYKNDKLPEQFGLNEYIDYWTQWEKTYVKPLTSVFDAMRWNIPNFSVKEAW